MNVVSLAESERLKEMNKVVDLYIKNYTPTQIAAELGIKRKAIDEHIKFWRETAVGMDIMRERVADLITSMDAHYSTLIHKAYEIIAEVDELRNDGKETMTRSQMLSQKKAAIDLIAKLEKDRIDILQKSGLIDAQNMGDELADMEMEFQRVMDVLERNLCEKCHPKILGALAGENDTVVVVVDE